MGDSFTATKDKNKILCHEHEATMQPSSSFIPEEEADFYT
jgi:hypothetical protein